MGTLYLVGTPIGNLEDISYRALRVLREAAVIAAEDTRQTRKLLTHFEIRTPLVSYHEHNQRTAGPVLIERLRAGDDVALVTDAGMPAISDPGEELVKLAVTAGITVVPIPGPTAFTAALVGSGLSTERFSFEGFLPTKKKERRALLAQLSQEPRTWMIYEAPHRVLETLADLADALGDRPMAAARELTKLHEEFVRGTPVQLLQHFELHAPRGEFVLVVGGAPRQEATVDPAEITPEHLTQAVAALEAEGVERKQAMKEVAGRYGLTKRDVYQALLAQKAEEE